ncbi:MAG: hypothetical protein ACLP6E_03845 [Acidimicrobiales bacterium]
MTRIRSAVVVLGLTTLLSSALSACSGSSSNVIQGTSTTQGATNTTQGATSTTQISATTEYLTIVAPVDVRERLFKDSTTAAEAELRAGPFATALQTWSARLAAFSWPSAAQSDVQALIADIPPLVSDLRGVAAGDLADINKAKIDGAPVTSGAEQVRSDLGLPADS